MAATYSSLVGLAVGGKYEIRRVMGVGGMGVVCEAVHLDLGKKIAIKLIDKTMKESELIVARFRREARAAGQIQSEHIVDVFDVGADARVGLYMVMEHLAGEDLQARIEREKKLDVKTAVMIAHQSARGLVKAHAAGVIHRDLKPANIYLTQRDNGQLLVKLLDFGVSKLLTDDAGSARITGAGAPIGTPLYMSPEQAEGKDSVDGRADIWSLGAVLYEALAGMPPFPDRGSYHGTIANILTSRPKPLHTAAPWVPLGLCKVIDAMLVHDCNARIHDAKAVTERLLEAYPAVLPDGTGQYTAVIVPQQQAAVDATSDTEFFTSTAFQAAQRALLVARAEGAGPPRVSSPPSSQQDSSKTVPDVSTGPPPAASVMRSRDATPTAAATPVGREQHDDSEIEPAPRATPRGPVTQPLLPPNPNSSSRGVAMPSTPPVIEPLPPMEIAPDTTRDDVLAIRAARRRRLTLAAVGGVILAVAVGGYWAGRRGAPREASPPPSATQPAFTAEVVPVIAPTASATATATAATAEPIETAAPAPTPVKHRPKPKPKPIVSAEAPKDVPAATSTPSPLDEPPTPSNP